LDEASGQLGTVQIRGEREARPPGVSEKISR